MQRDFRRHRRLGNLRRGDDEFAYQQRQFVMKQRRSRDRPQHIHRVIICCMGFNLRSGIYVETVVVSVRNPRAVIVIQILSVEVEKRSLDESPE